MFLRELITEARAKSPPVIAYHGTLAKHLESILDQGLVANKEGGGWGSSEGGSARQRSLQALPGVYITTDIVTGLLATSLSPGRKLLVIINAQPRSAVIDEDPVDVEIEKAITNAVESEGSTAEYYELFIQSPRNEIRGLMYDLPEEMTDLLSRNRDMAKIIYSAIRYNLERELSYGAHADISDKRLRQNIPDPRTAEANYRKVLDRITASLKRLGYENTNQSKNADSLRIRGDVGFSGKNRILCILSYDDFSDNSYRVEYGKVPEKTIEALQKIAKDNPLEIKGNP